MTILGNKQQLSQYLELYRKLSGYNAKTFIEHTHISLATYSRIVHDPQKVSDRIYLKLLNEYHFNAESSCSLTLIKEEIKQLHEALNYYRQEECIRLIQKILAILTQIKHDIIGSILLKFFSSLQEYFLNLKYLSEDEILAYMNHHHLFHKELSEIICFYCTYSSTKISYAFESKLYQDHTELIDSLYLPIKAHAMSMYEHRKAFEETILVGKELLDEAVKTKNTVMMYEYYDCMVGYYVQCEPKKIIPTFEKMKELARRDDFPFTKKKQFYMNAARYCMRVQDYAKSLEYLTCLLDIPEKNSNNYACLVLNILFCESQLGIISDVERYKRINQKYFQSKADYQLFQYFMEKENFTNHKKLTYLEKHVIPYLKENDGVTRYQIEIELNHLMDTVQRKKVLKQLLD